MKKELDLRGLRLIVGGYLIELVALLLTGQATTGWMNGSKTMALAITAAALIAMLLLLRGLVLLRGASFFFPKAKKYIWIRIALALVALVFFLVSAPSGNWTASGVTQMERGALLEVTIVLLVLAALWIGSVLLTTRALLRGCGNLAEMADQPEFSLRCLRTWRFWRTAVLLLVLITMAAIAIIINVLRKTLESGQSGQALYDAVMTNVASSALLASIIIIFGLLFFLIMHILYLVRLRNTYKTFHLEEVEEPQPEIFTYEELQQYALPDEEEEAAAPEEPMQDLPEEDR